MDEKISEVQFLQQNLQSLLMQKQAFQMEIDETELALNELKLSGEEIYKIVGQLMIKSEKNKTVEELNSKKELLEKQMENVEKQEKILNDRISKLRDEITSNMGKEKKDSKK
jgi:prefoldin beta subunit